MAVTGKEYADKVKEVYNLTPKAGYIYGTAGVLWTQARQDALKKKYQSDPDKYADFKLGAQIGSKWIGHNVWDCSGLTSERAAKLGLKYHHGSNSSWNYDCAYKGKLAMGMSVPVGAWVYTGTDAKKPHIGVVVDRDWVVEAQGTNNGVIRSRISDSKWKYWGLGKGIEFEFIPNGAVKQTTSTATTTKTTTTTTKKPTLRRGAKGETVKELQTLLTKAGSNLAIDGIFGPGTQSAVRAFQKKHNLVVDGIVGPKTWGELLKLK